MSNPHRSSSLAPALLFGLPFALLGSEGPIVFQPDAGTKVERTYTWTESMETTDLAFLQGGEDATDAPRAESKVERTRTLGVIDEFVRSAPNQPLEFVRRYDDTTEEASGKLVLTSPAGEAKLPIAADGTSELEGIGVRFVWDDSEEEWTKTFADDFEGREELLEPLTMTHDFIALLPASDRDIAAGDEWEVDARKIHEILRPGGGLPLDIETDLDAIEGALDPMLLPGVFDTLDGKAEGDITARVEAIEEGRATIGYEFDVRVASDQDDAIDALLGDALPDGVTGVLVSAKYVTSIEGSATLVWDLEAKHAVSLEFDAETVMEIDVTVEIDADGQTVEFQLKETREGKVGLTLE